MADSGWLDEATVTDLVEAIDWNGNTLGWMTRSDAKRLHMSTQVIETPKRWLEDIYVRHVANMCAERRLFDGKDLNDVQVLLVASNLMKRREFEARLRDKQFEEMLFANNPELYASYMEKRKEEKEAEDFDGVAVEQRPPTSVEEFLATLAAFSEGEDSDSDKGQQDGLGWLASVLSEDDLDQMDD